MSEVEQLRKEINNCHVYLDECYVNDPATAPNETTLMVRLVALVKLIGELRDEIERLNTIVEFGKALNNSRVDEIIELRRTIELWRTADGKAVAVARAEAARFYSVLEDAWYQFAYVDGNGKRWCGGLSTLEDMADVLEIDV